MVCGTKKNPRMDLNFASFKSFLFKFQISKFKEQYFQDSMHAIFILTLFASKSSDSKQNYASIKGKMAGVAKLARTRGK